jgi:predicted CoA-binding protein
MTLPILDLLERPDVCIAVVGANDNPAKFGYRIYRDLKRKGFSVRPVNPNRSTVDGDRSYARLEDLPEPPDIVNVVVPPDVTLAVLEKCRALGLMNVWLQPGAENAEVLDYLEQHRFNYLAQTCIMVKSRAKRVGD